jgi:hypothetical protein
MWLPRAFRKPDGEFVQNSFQRMVCWLIESAEDPECFAAVASVFVALCVLALIVWGIADVFSRDGLQGLGLK